MTDMERHTEKRPAGSPRRGVLHWFSRSQGWFVSEPILEVIDNKGQNSQSHEQDKKYLGNPCGCCGYPRITKQASDDGNSKEDDRP